MAKGGRLNFVCVDNSENSAKGFEWYLTNLHRSNDTIGIVHVQRAPTLPTISGVTGGVSLIDEYQKHIQECYDEAKLIQNKFEKICKMKNLKCNYFLPNAHHSPGHVICELAKEKKASNIVLGQRGLGTVSRALIGSTSDFILHHADIPVLVVPHCYMNK